MLTEVFYTLLQKYTANSALINECWEEIEKNYSGSKRHYHTLAHLENLLLQLTEVKAQLHDWETVMFSLYYHDLIYNALKSNNEEKSADLAAKRMAQLGIESTMIERCRKQILATKSHQSNEESDTNYFLDADLSVLGLPWGNYVDYYKNVRKEYAIYPDLIYNPGRKKVLQHFLNMCRIFKTDHFFQKFESIAKENLQRELDLL